jgi:hypothetical protein
LKYLNEMKPKLFIHKLDKIQSFFGKKKYCLTPSIPPTGSVQ